MEPISFNHIVTRYLQESKQWGLELDTLRAEIHIESGKDWSRNGSLSDLEQWFLTQQQQCKMDVSNIPLIDCKGWHIDKSTGWIHHQSGEFFVVQGIRVSLTENREIKNGWDQPIVTQVGFDGGILGLLRKRIDSIPHYLIEAKAEPGNPDKVQISPTLQATFSNLKQAHGGNKPRFSEFFEFPEKHNCKILFSQWMSEDGGRLHLKRNKGMLVEIPESEEIILPNNFRWVSLYQLKTLIKQNSWVNPHIRGIISHL